MDAHVVAVAARVPGSVIYADDLEDLEAIVAAADQTVEIARVPSDPWLRHPGICGSRRRFSEK